MVLITRSVPDATSEKVSVSVTASKEPALKSSDMADEMVGAAASAAAARRIFAECIKEEFLLIGLHSVRFQKLERRLTATFVPDEATEKTQLGSAVFFTSGQAASSATQG
ncbi:hypothetical protein [Actibacterium sp. 188UL27-1]|uniref:hypothetical protein n=1 Tax=Actibacterium sp. 188UL27-1 TaxID=2786961 RepID=UPI001956A350|nr:hypothetical protein [Actibacterium sp. 188UL27-1]MBM7070225.1 hypothetical protein [Actibacterium sp. 188UL27-1]